MISDLQKRPQQTFVGLEDVLKTPSKHVLRTSSTLLQRNNFSSSKTSWRRLEDALTTSRETSLRRRQEFLKTCCKTKNCYAEDVFKTSCRHVLKTSWRCLEDIFGRRLEEVLKTSWKCLEEVFARRREDFSKTFWRRLGKTSWKYLEDVLKTYDQGDCIGLDQVILKTSSEDVWVKGIYSSWRRKTSSSRRMFAGAVHHHSAEELFWTTLRKLSFFKIETFKSLEELKNFKSRKKVMQPIFSIKNF